VLGGSFSFLRTVNPGSLSIFQNQRIANSSSLGKNNSKIKKPLKNLKEPSNFHEGICQDPMIFWPIL
jgi:hypothetical protein